MNTYRFVKEGGSWYIDLPEYLAQGGSEGDLQMVEGADTMLDIMSEGAPDVTLAIDREPFDGSDMLRLVERCDPYIGGGYYFFETFEGRIVNQRMWLCAVTEFVFGDLPEKIYVKRIT